jgi:hypothetical protein
MRFRRALFNRRSNGNLITISRSSLHTRDDTRSASGENGIAETARAAQRACGNARRLRMSRQAALSSHLSGRVRRLQPTLATLGAEAAPPMILARYLEWQPVMVVATAKLFLIARGRLRMYS